MIDSGSTLSSRLEFLDCCTVTAAFCCQHTDMPIDMWWKPWQLQCSADSRCSSKRSHWHTMSSSKRSHWQPTSSSKRSHWQPMSSSKRSHWQPMSSSKRSHWQPISSRSQVAWPLGVHVTYSWRLLATYWRPCSFCASCIHGDNWPRTDDHVLFVSPVSLEITGHVLTTMFFLCLLYPSRILATYWQPCCFCASVGLALSFRPSRPTNYHWEAIHLSC